MMQTFRDQALALNRHLVRRPWRTVSGTMWFQIVAAYEPEKTIAVGKTPKDAWQAAVHKIKQTPSLRQQ